MADNLKVVVKGIDDEEQDQEGDKNVGLELRTTLQPYGRKITATFLTLELTELELQQLVDNTTIQLRIETDDLIYTNHIYGELKLPDETVKSKTILPTQALIDLVNGVQGSNLAFIAVKFEILTPQQTTLTIKISKHQKPPTTPHTPEIQHQAGPSRKGKGKREAGLLDPEGQAGHEDQPEQQEQPGDFDDDGNDKGTKTPLELKNLPNPGYIKPTNRVYGLIGLIQRMVNIQRVRNSRTSVFDVFRAWTRNYEAVIRANAHHFEDESYTGFRITTDQNATCNIVGAALIHAHSETEQIQILKGDAHACTLFQECLLTWMAPNNNDGIMRPQKSTEMIKDFIEIFFNNACFTTPASRQGYAMMLQTTEHGTTD